jgi:hypothetical protein
MATRTGRGRIGRALVGLLGVGIATVAVALPGAAQADGCRATIDGIDVRTAHSPKSAIRVDADATVVVSGEAPGPITSYAVDLVFGPFSFRGAEGTVASGETGYTTTVDVADYARYGVGLYRVEGRTTGTVCEEWTYVEIVGRSPLATVAGGAGAAATVAGLAGMGATAAAAATARSAAGAAGSSTVGTGGAS